MRSPTAVCSALVLAWLGSVGVARTETAVAENAAKDAPTPADNPAIAPPAPGAPPQKVEDAKKTAKVPRSPHPAEPEESVAPSLPTLR